MWSVGGGGDPLQMRSHERGGHQSPGSSDSLTLGVTQHTAHRETLSNQADIHFRSLAVLAN